LVRVHWTKSKLLEWKTFSDAERIARSDLMGFFKAMLVAPAIATAVLVCLILLRPEVLLEAGPLLAMWFVSPAVAWWLSRPILPTPVELTRKQLVFLRRSARKTWRYFETFVTEDDNWLPPDNVEMNPGEVIASRTSPTNIGMALLADLAAHDLGISRSPVCSTARKRRSARCRRWNIIEAIFSTGTTHELWNHLIRCTFRPSTAEILPDISMSLAAVSKNSSTPNTSGAYLRWPHRYAGHSAG
jgi:hypothetical protein